MTVNTYTFKIKNMFGSQTLETYTIPSGTYSCQVNDFSLSGTCGFGNVIFNFSPINENNSIMTITILDYALVTAGNTYTFSYQGNIINQDDIVNPDPTPY